jgi:hypothetical protein
MIMIHRDMSQEWLPLDLLLHIFGDKEDQISCRQKLIPKRQDYKETLNQTKDPKRIPVLVRRKKQASALRNPRRECIWKWSKGW